MIRQYVAWKALFLIFLFIINILKTLGFLLIFILNYVYVIYQVKLSVFIRHHFTISIAKEIASASVLKRNSTAKGPKVSSLDTNIS